MNIDQKLDQLATLEQAGHLGGSSYLRITAGTASSTWVKIGSRWVPLTWRDDEPLWAQYIQINRVEVDPDLDPRGDGFRVTRLPGADEALRCAIGMVQSMVSPYDR